MMLFVSQFFAKPFVSWSLTSSLLEFRFLSYLEIGLMRRTVKSWATWIDCATREFYFSVFLHLSGLLALVNQK
jgi:hypothetical protein